MKKLLICLLGLSLLAGSTVFAQEEAENTMGFSFVNKLGTPVAIITPKATKFAGLFDQMEFGFESEKISAGLTVRTNLGVDADGVPTSFFFNSDYFDWNLAYTPFSFITVGLHTQNTFDGSYLYVADDNISVGRMGSDGLSLTVTPVEGLSIGASLPFGFNPDDIMNFKNDGLSSVIGANYTMDDVFSVSTSFMDIGLSDFRCGVYGTFNKVEKLTVGAGYTYNAIDDAYVTGTNVINLDASYSVGKSTMYFDYVTNTDGNFYAAGFVNYKLGKVIPNFTATATTTYSDFANGKFVLTPGAIVVLPSGYGKLSMKCNVTFNAGKFASVNFPVVWVYSFSK